MVVQNFMTLHPKNTDLVRFEFLQLPLHLSQQERDVDGVRTALVYLTDGPDQMFHFFIVVWLGLSWAEKTAGCYLYSKGQQADDAYVIIYVYCLTDYLSFLFHVISFAKWKIRTNMFIYFYFATTLLYAYSQFRPKFI